MKTVEEFAKALSEKATKWHATYLGEVLVDGNGKIVGEITKAIGIGYLASCGTRQLGTYISSAAAKRAVEEVA